MLVFPETLGIGVLQDAGITLATDAAVVVPCVSQTRIGVVGPRSPFRRDTRLAALVAPIASPRPVAATRKMAVRRPRMVFQRPSV